MKLTRPDVAAYALVALCLVLATVLMCLGKPVPELLQFVTVTALGAGAGVASQGAVAPTTPPAAADAPASPPAAPYRLPAPAVAAPLSTDTGVFPRIATHTP